MPFKMKVRMNRNILNCIMLIVTAGLITSCAGLNPSGLWMQGKFQETVDLFEKGEYKEKQWSQGDQFYLCLAYLKTKRYDKIDCPLKFTEVYGKNTFMRAQVYMYAERAYANIDLGRYNEALKDAESALKFAKGDWFGDAKPLALGAAGLAHAFLGNKDKALEYAEKSEGAMGAGALILSTRTVNINKDEALAKIYMALGQYEDVIRVTERSKGAGFGDIMTAPFWVLGHIVESAEGSKHAKLFYQDRSSIPQAFMLSKAYYETGNLEKAEAGLEFVLTFPSIESFGSIYWVSLYNMGMIKINKGEKEEGVALLKKAVSSIENQRRSINVEASKIGFVGNKQSVYLDLVDALLHMKRHDEAFEYVERSKARALVDILASKKRFQRAVDDNPMVQTLLKDLDHTEIVDSTKVYQLPTEDVATTSTSMRAIAIRQKLTETDPNLASLVTVMPPDLNSLLRMIPKDETLIEFYGDDRRFFVFIVTPQQIEGLAIECAGLNHKVQRFRENIQTPGSDLYKAEAKDLYQMLFIPIVPKIKTRKITIVPHGPLHYLPFNAIGDASGSLLNYYTIRILPSASVLQYLKPDRKAPKSALVLGNPDLGNPNFDLPFASQEAKTIARILPEAKLLLRGRATETSIKKTGGNFGTLHFASHGTFNSDAPLMSGLMLAKDNENDGMLTVGELYDLKLNAELVTLSACETALGKVTHGDDVVGFTRGFLYAGANSIISSLWQVDDRATGELMQAFYLNLKSSNKRDALRNAQLKLKKDPRTTHPFYWAAFQLTGAE